MVKMGREEDEPAFQYMVQANGQSEVWSNTTTDHSNLKEYGWRPGLNKDIYGLRTLMGNWLEERCDLKALKIPEPFPSQFDHYFNTMYNSTYNTMPKTTVPEVLKDLYGRHPYGFPQHQPELDTECLKMQTNSWKTTYRAEYINPELRLTPSTFQGYPIPFCETLAVAASKTASKDAPPVSSAERWKEAFRDNRPSSETWLHPPVRKPPGICFNRHNTKKGEKLHPGFRQQPVDFWSRYSPFQTTPDLFGGEGYIGTTILPTNSKRRQVPALGAAFGQRT